MGDQRVLLDSVACAHFVSSTWGVDCKPVLVRQWASRGRIGRHELDGVTVYDLKEVVARARESGLIPSS